MGGGGFSPLHPSVDASDGFNELNIPHVLPDPKGRQKRRVVCAGFETPHIDHVNQVVS